MKKRIDLLLVERKLVETLSKAQAHIMAGQVFVEGQIVKKSGETYFSDSNITLKRLNKQWVSRGSLKILHVIKYFNLKIDDFICLDIGASTGGFTEVLLNYNAKKIFAVDVGKNQLHERLKKEKRIINLEKTNARYLNNNIINESVNLIVCDASFISLRKVLKPSLNFLKKNNGIVVALIKPQFEAKKHELSRGGVVTNTIVHQRICDEISSWFIHDCKMDVLGITTSPLKGPKGNIEFFIVAKN